MAIKRWEYAEVVTSPMGSLRGPGCVITIWGNEVKVLRSAGKGADSIEIKALLQDGWEPLGRGFSTTRCRCFRREAV